jgi:hypothetical protein
MPAELPCHLIRQRKDFFRGVLVKPVIQRALVAISMNIDLTRELALKTGKHIVKWKCVCAKMHPT